MTKTTSTKTRSKRASSLADKSPPAKKARTSRKTAASKSKASKAPSDSETGALSESSSDDGSDAYQEEEEAIKAGNHSEGDDEDLDSDALDEEDEDVGRNKRRKTAPKKKASTTMNIGFKKRKRDKEQEEGEKEEYDDDDDEGIEIVGKIVQAPKTGQVPPGRISQNTLDFLQELHKPECNDRTWFKLHEPVYRQAEKEWVAFIDKLIPLITETDDQIPPLPPKDLIHRIYRDMRFSNDKTPYKRCFSAGWSRSGRKGIFAGYYLHIQPGNKSLLAAGIWSPAKNELATFRSNILHDPSPLRDVISDPEFVKVFGAPKPHPKGNRQNVFGGDDMLKVAPKGIDKTHPDIDLLKLRSVAVIHYFEDEEVLAHDFQEEVLRIMTLQRPFVHVLNDFITLPAGENGNGSDD